MGVFDGKMGVFEVKMGVFELSFFSSILIGKPVFLRDV
jgi:hypothetical protein